MMLKLLAAFVIFGLASARVNVRYDRARLREALEQMCQKAGAEDRVDEAERGILTFADCFNGLVDMESMGPTLEKQGMDMFGAILTFVKNTCKKQSEILSCVNTGIDAVSLCSDSKIQAKINETKQGFVEATDLFCKDDSKAFSEFINDGALQCMLDQRLQLTNRCMRQIQTLSNYKTLTTEQACVSVNGLTSCFMDVLESCPKASTPAFVRSLFRAVYKGSYCEFPEEDKKIQDNTI
ncbi:27 kDa glycoprotein-like [Ostrinia nubilalis]|uniref:27 kDa glycoprotein-like n=1 Tax=Ostrinia nubilalis TaxID=29057 RepID=UPI003082364D